MDDFLWAASMLESRGVSLPLLSDDERTVVEEEEESVFGVLCY